ncbi:transcriptional regulator of acetoin/glycerol metabolism [Planifilum fimeticola]|uniref:Transcriptional regulator of acetoin/glycerol metabolism n=1 Tax=Planifilum fimeticola TaxID=201975 RepID=A0A2T0LA20_9BACL|nr:sigma-54-dependent Fis family transcriptional regulator [Planifilum fimeticola]PRX38605.1 transcriptional regulator of acetoin/glycerol metabolism [Planifilum fimeticola]
MAKCNIAIYSTLEVNQKKRELASKWEYFVRQNRKPREIRSVIYDSWKRCQQYGVDPYQKQSIVVLPDDRLAELIHKSRLYRVSQPIIKDLEKQIRDTKHLITLCDKTGCILYLQGEHRILNMAEKMNFVKGANWSERAAGSNAIGTCIATGQPVQVFAYEHYCEGAHPWVCSAAPIKDPLTGELLGVFDLTGPCDLAQPHSLFLAQNISTLIQQSFATISYKIRQYLLDQYSESVRRWRSDSIIALDSMFNVVAAGPNCLSLLRLENWEQFWRRPELNPLKTEILSGNGEESEVYLDSLQLNVYILNIIYDGERIGYLLRLEKYQKRRFSKSNSPNWRGLIGQSYSFQYVIQQAQIASPTDVPILITGESGTGKERFARAIHHTSLRRDAPFIALNCGAIPKELMASELFGYEPGVFTGGDPKGKKGKFEEANGGTLLLDEIGEMPLDLQVHLLRVLQEKEVVRLGSSRPIPIDVRIIAATNQNLIELIQRGQFRMDLYFRLNVVEIKLPPLRERKEDIVPLCLHFVEKCSKKLGKPVPTIDERVFSYLRDYHWPGNIRELENAMEYAVLFCSDNHITVSSLPESLRIRLLENELSERKNFEKLTTLEQNEKNKIIQLLIETNNNLSEVARRCGIARTTLYRKLKKYNLR